MNLDIQPRIPLARTPTPLHEAERLRAALGGPDVCPRILLKRDDLTDLALGGNKARKLEYLFGDARRQGATAVVTTGGPQSNHARMTAAAARLLGMEVTLVLGAGVDTPADQGNLLLDRLLGADVRFAREGDGMTADEAEIAAIGEAMRDLEAKGRRPYLVELGGSCRIGVLGYVAATRELAGQLRETQEKPTRLYHASGSRGTQAGLELGARIFDATYRVHGIAVSGGEGKKRAKATEIANDAAQLIGVDIRIDADELITHQEYFGEGYAIPTPLCVAAIEMLARTEGVIVDPVYTGKAMAGMIDHIRSREIDPSETIVFLHTGGSPGLFAQADAVLELLGRR
jgi:D-cysteine desulfhydrase family pyridoxal phosphate-dependent enzyme